MNPTPFRLPRGVLVPDLEGITEGFAVSTPADRNSSFVRANVSAERIADVFLELAALVDTPGFLMLGVPTSRPVEQEFHVPERPALHRDFHYLDGLDGDGLRSIFGRYRELLVEDGMVTFGFGSHAGLDEVNVGRYKVFEILSTTPVKYTECLLRLGYPRRESLRTVRHTFSPTTPGRLGRIEIEGRNVFDMVTELAREGLYFGGRRVE
jgi:hypothetical protein